MSFNVDNLVIQPKPLELIFGYYLSTPESRNKIGTDEGFRKLNQILAEADLLRSDPEKGFNKQKAK